MKHMTGSTWSKSRTRGNMDTVSSEVTASRKMIKDKSMPNDIKKTMDKRLDRMTLKHNMRSSMCGRKAYGITSMTGCLWPRSAKPWATLDKVEECQSVSYGSNTLGICMNDLATMKSCGKHIKTNAEFAEWRVAMWNRWMDGK